MDDMTQIATPDESTYKQAVMSDPTTGYTDTDDDTDAVSTPDPGAPDPDGVGETISFEKQYEIVVGTVWMREFGQPRADARRMYKAVVTPTEQAPEDTDDSVECIDTAPVDAVAGALYALQMESEAQ